MFTGIVSQLGEIVARTDTQLTISAPVGSLKLGDSMAVNGVCLTVTSLSESGFGVEVTPETLSRTNLGALEVGQQVNLEQPLLVDGRLDGHFVQGHVDGTGTVSKVEIDGNSHLLTINYPAELDRYIVEKGSVTVDGISLTVASVRQNRFTVSIIPHTWTQTNLQYVEVGKQLNLEVDILAKYLEKLTHAH